MGQWIECEANCLRAYNLAMAMKRYKYKDTDKNNFLQIGVETGRWLSKHLADGRMTSNYVEDCSDDTFWMPVAT